ncbi:MacB-like core domain-containing protein [Alteromonadaceae bacterium Bs31]|nr:MacB-like core domain-containing protein [Alteromonadaceae bacterium Bs31]
MTDILPAFKILMRNPLGPILIVIQIGLTIAILTTLYLFISSLSELVLRDSGLDEQYIGRFSIDLNMPEENRISKIREDIRYLNQHSKLDFAAALNRAPFDPWLLIQNVRNKLQVEGAKVSLAHIQMTDEFGLRTLGAELLEGRDFTERDVKYANNLYLNNLEAQFVIINEALADFLFEGEPALGKQLFWGDKAYQVIGISENVYATNAPRKSVAHTVFVPSLFTNDSFHYVVRSKDPIDEQLIRELEAELREGDRNRVVGQGAALSKVKEDNRGQIAYSLKLMMLIFGLLVLVCGFGVISLTSFRVATNKRHIGIRRAMGATRWQICRYFLVENVLLFVAAMTIGGILSPMIVSIFNRGGQNIQLPWHTLLITGSIMLLAMLCAAAYPAIQASRVAPVSVSGSSTAKR